MQEIVDFLAGQWPVVAMLVVAIVLLIRSYMNEGDSVDASEAVRLINQEDAIVIDVREKAEFDAGHINSSIHVPLSQVPKRLSELQKHKGKAVIVSCRSGSRSGVAARQLRKGGFEKVYNLRGGLLGWEQAKLPTFQ